MRAHLTAVLLALVAAALLAAPAGASHHAFRLGVTDLPDLSAADISGMGAANAKTFRVGFSWARIEDQPPPDAGSSCAGAKYDWSYTNRLVSQAGRRGVEVLPYIAGSPRYVASKSAHAPLTSDRREIEPYKCFVRALVARYGRGGAYPSTNAAAKPIKQWQVWNEPNLVKFATKERGVNPREYARLVKITRRQILPIDRRATIALAGLPVVGNGFDPSEYLRKFYRVRGIERKFDVIAVHPYARSYRGVKGAVLRLRSLLKDVRDRGRYIWITETGWATHGSEFRFMVKGTRGQAQQLTRTFKMLRKNRGRWNIGTVVWFRWRDQAVPSQNRGAFDYAGLYKKNGKPKPSCKRFVRFTNGRCRTLP